MSESLDACFFVDEPPEIEFRDGMFRITQRVGNYSFERAMSPHVFAKTVWRGEQALALFRSGAKVVQLKGKVDPVDDVLGSH
jgi:hypothetical protein